MVNYRIVVFLISMAVVALVLAGCSDDPTAPEEQLAPPSLGSGFAFTSWSLYGATCADGQFCLSKVSVSRNRLDMPELNARVSGESGTFSQSISITVEDYDDFRSVVESVLAVRGDAPEGCIPSDGFREVVSTFSGDTGLGAQIEGCDDPVVQQLREQARYLVAKYFSED